MLALLILKTNTSFPFVVYLRLLSENRFLKVSTNALRFGLPAPWKKLKLKHFLFLHPSNVQNVLHNGSAGQHFLVFIYFLSIAVVVVVAVAVVFHHKICVFIIFIYFFR